MISQLPSRRAVAAAALGLLASGFTAGCSPSMETNPAGEPGATRELEAADRGGASFTVAMPDGTYTVTDVAVHSSVGPEARRLVAPEGAVIVSLDVGDAVRESYYPLGNTASTFQVVAGSGEVFSLESSGVARGAGVVIPGDGTDAVIEVVHEGRSARFAVADGERLDDEPLFATSGIHVADEPLPQDEDGEVEFVEDSGPEISARMVHQTFSSEAGWAPKGSAWLEAFAIGFSTPGMAISGEDWVEVVGEVTSVRLIVDGAAVDTDTELTPERVLLAWAAVPLGAVRAALEVTYDLTINGEIALSGGTYTLEDVELAGLSV